MTEEQLTFWERFQKTKESNQDLQDKLWEAKSAGDVVVIVREWGFDLSQDDVETIKRLWAVMTEDNRTFWDRFERAKKSDQSFQDKLREAKGWEGVIEIAQEFGLNPDQHDIEQMRRWSRDPRIR